MAYKIPVWGLFLITRPLEVIRLRLTLKLVSVLLFIVLALEGVDGYLSVRREHELFLQKMRENAFLLGEVTSRLFHEVWEHGGSHRALSLIQEINRSEPKIRVRWVTLDSPDPLFTPRVPADSIRSLLGRPAPSFTYVADGERFLALYVPVAPSDSTLGLLEMTQSYRDEADYIRESLIRTLVLSAALVLAAGGAVLLIGAYFVGRPLHNLVERTRLIGEGDFSPVAVPPGHDEISLLFSSVNDMCGHLGQARDRVRIETERRVAAIEQLRHTDRLATVGRLASGIAHELGTPLNVVSGRAKMICGDAASSSETVHSSRVIAEQSERMAAIIRQLLDFARRPRTERTSTDIAALVRQVFNLLAPMARKASVTFSLVAPDHLPRVPIDPSQIQQALTNLVVNAIQAMPSGGEITAVITASSRTWPGEPSAFPRPCVTVAVSDQGAGIAPDDLPRIFDPFFTTKDVGSGTGLGLSIIHGIIQDHGGFVDVSSEVGHGATFTLGLPLSGEPS